MALEERLVLPARRGLLVELGRGDQLQVVNTSGSQVVDTWAFAREDPSERMSMEHTRAKLLKVRPEVGDALVTNQRRPILRLVDDSSPGIHDTLMPSCDRWRYEQLGCVDYHDNCADNLTAAIAERGWTLDAVPGPFNLFMHVPVSADLALAFDAPVSRPGDAVTLEAELDCVVVMSACPQDILPVNGRNLTPTSVDLVVRRGQA